MKKLVFLILTVFATSLSAGPIELKIEDIAEKVSKDNFMVLENAERVYQKKESIKFARANLLPKLNIWNLLKLPAVFVDPLAVGDVIQDIAPFLVPANWFKVGQSKHLYKAQKEQYRALWANEVNTSKLLFYSVYRDKQFSVLLRDKKSNYKEIMEIAKIRNIFGSGNLFAYNLIRDRYLSLVEDSRNIENLVFNETKELQFLTGINNEEEVRLIQPNLPNLENASKIEFSKIIFKAIEASPEVFQYEHLLNALAKVKGQINFSILGASTFSLGEGNGVFDHIPIQDGLGFGMGASVKITKSEGRILKTQLKATIETIKKQVNVLVNEYNSLITNYRITQERIALANSNYNAMMSYISIGGTLDVLEMTEILDNLYASRILLLSYKYRFSELVEKLMRITFSEDYSNGPSFILGGQNESKNITPLILTILISVSCTDDEKRFVEMIDFTKKAKAELVENATFPNLDLDNLSFLKIYSDSVSKGDLLFEEVLKSKKSTKRVKKYLLNNTNLSLLCDSLFIGEVIFLELKGQCDEGYFNICPRSFSNYESNTLEIIKKIKGLIGEDAFSSSDCNNVIKEEV